ncbi:hypothetical protein K456DRAFT_636251 [Colletotrichum gloeosporioides 23]|nr:hypothetical protein K456DRAFT_636251 [Colletotrichum gloeosporioides 23]
MGTRCRSKCSVCRGRDVPALAGNLGSPVTRSSFFEPQQQQQQWQHQTAAASKPRRRQAEFEQEAKKQACQCHVNVNVKQAPAPSLLACIDGCGVREPSSTTLHAVFHHPKGSHPRARVSWMGLIIDVRLIPDAHHPFLSSRLCPWDQHRHGTRPPHQT